MNDNDNKDNYDIDAEFNKIIEGNNVLHGSHVYKPNNNANDNIHEYDIVNNDKEPITNNDDIKETSSIPYHDNYFEDDELIEAGDDKVLLEEKNLAIFQQNENVITWEIDNFYNDKDEPKNKTSLRLDPPVLRVKSSDGKIVEFVLTKELSKSFNSVFDEVYKAYFGIKVKDKNNMDQDTIQGKLKQVAETINNHKVLSSFIFILILFVFVSPILF